MFLCVAASARLSVHAGPSLIPFPCPRLPCCRPSRCKCEGSRLRKARQEERAPKRSENRGCAVLCCAVRPCARTWPELSKPKQNLRLFFLARAALLAAQCILSSSRSRHKDSGRIVADTDPPDTARRGAGTAEKHARRRSSSSFLTLERGPSLLTLERGRAWLTVHTGLALRLALVGGGARTKKERRRLLLARCVLSALHRCTRGVSNF